MKVIMNPSSSLRDVGRVLGLAERNGCPAHVFREEGRVTVCFTRAEDPTLINEIEGLAGVEELRPFSRSFKLVSREYRRRDTVVRVGGCRIGSDEVALIAGPCAVESESQLFAAAEALARAGAHLLRGGAYKPRSSPYAFQGLKEEGLRLLARARERFGLPVVTEVLTAEDVPLVEDHADVLQVGSRNMQNYSLLEALGRSSRPVLLKRGMMSTIEEFLLSAEYIVSGGNPNVILCERGIRTFERQTRNTLDLVAVVAIKDLSHLPVVVDPSHGTGHRQYVIPAAKAGLAAGADGLIVEVHPHPEEALCDGAQSLTVEGFEKLVREVTPLAGVLGKKVLTGQPAA